MYHDVTDLVRLWVDRHGYFGLFGLLLFGIAGLPMPDETLLVFAGYLAFSGRLRLAPTMITAFGGSCCGISVSYVLGRSAGAFLVQRLGPALRLTSARVERTQARFDRLGPWAFTAGFFVPGVRQLAALLAGSTRVSWSVFAVFAALGALLWSQTYVLAGYFFGESWRRLAAPTRHALFRTAGLAAAGLGLAVLLWRRRARRRHRNGSR